MRILITGSEGKIGKELMKLMDSHEVYPVDKRGGASYKLNLAYDSLASIADFKPEIIIHLAASFERTDETPQFHNINYADNIIASYRLNQLVAGFGYCPKQYIFASSYLVYDPRLYLSERGDTYKASISESNPLMPRNLIGASKLYVENEIDFLKRNVHKEMKVSHLRIFRVFGEGGQEFVSRILEGKQMNIPVQIWNPLNRFDYIHTSDCASAIMAVIGHDGIYNVGYGLTTSIQSILDLIQPKIVYSNSNELYECSKADTSKITDETGWIPKINVLEWIKWKL